MIDIDKYIEAIQIKWIKKLKNSKILPIGKSFLSITLTSLALN